jgi:hypothetical protein
MLRRWNNSSPPHFQIVIFLVVTQLDLVGEHQLYEVTCCLDSAQYDDVWFPPTFSYLCMYRTTGYHNASETHRENHKSCMSQGCLQNTRIFITKFPSGSVGLATGPRDGRLRNRGSVTSKEKRCFHSVRTGYGAHPACCKMGIGAYIPWGNVAGAWTWPLTSI